MIVLDASAATTVLLNVDGRSAAIRERMGRADVGLHVPHLFDVEVLQALRRHALRRDNLSKERSLQALEALQSLRATRYPHAALLARIWELRENLTAYDAAYVALAETLAAPLVTTDARLARLSGHHATVELYG